MASSDSPKASATPRLPICVPARTALPTPPNTSTNVPTSSATYFFMNAPAFRQGRFLRQGDYTPPNEGRTSKNSANLPNFGEWPRKSVGASDLSVLLLVPLD